MKLLLLVLFSGLVVVGVPAKAQSNALSPEALRALRSPEHAVLYSLEPLDQPKLGDETLGRFKVLGKTPLDSNQVGLVTSAFEKATKDWNGMRANCFDPRQALVFSSGGHTYEFVICYACQELDISMDGKGIDALGVTGSPKILNDLLTAGHVPLARPEQ